MPTYLSANTFTIVGTLFVLGLGVSNSLVGKQYHIFNLNGAHAASYFRPIRRCVCLLMPALRSPHQRIPGRLQLAVLRLDESL